MRILCDMDGVIVNLLPRWLDCINRDQGLNARPENINKWELGACPPLDKLKLHDIIKWLSTPGFLLNAPIFPFASEVLESISKRHELYICTARTSRESVPATLEWAKREIPWFDKSKFIFSTDKHIIKGDVLIEDKGETVENYTKHWPKADTVLVDYPYNQNFLCSVRICSTFPGNHWPLIHSYIEENYG